MTAPLGADPADLRAVEAIVRKAGTSFGRGMRILGPDRRAAMYAVYAFCRVVDDIADEPAPLDEKREELAAWRVRIAERRAEDALTRVLLLARDRYELREADFLAVIDGMEADAETPIVAPEWADLDRYCDQVASAVGRLSVRVFGDASHAADEVAFHLGRALQLTNILRDLEEDAARGRLYLPWEYLEAARVPATPDRALESPNLPAVCMRVAAEAEAHYRAAYGSMERCKPAAMRPARIMAATYHAVLRALVRRGFNRPWGKARVPTWEKTLIAARFLASAARAG